MPFVHIEGAISPHPVSWATPDERKEALGRWISIVAKEAAKPYETSERGSVKQFVHSHRLSVASAFERRIVRADVVAELLRLYRVAGPIPQDDRLHLPER